MPKKKNNDELFVTMLGHNGLPTERVNLATPDGANRFLSAENGNYSVTTFLNRIDELTSKRNRQACSYDLTGLYSMIYYFAVGTSDEAFGVLHPERELGGLIGHIKEQLPTIATTKRWKKEGKLTKYDEQMIACLISYNSRLVFVKKALAEGLWETMVELLQSVQNHHKLPSPDVTEDILSAVSNAHLTMYYGSSAEDSEPGLKQLEKTGILTQVLRLITQPTPHQRELPGHIRLLDDLASCVYFVRKRFKEGQPGGDMLKAVLSGQEGFNQQYRNPSVVRRLLNLDRVASGILTANASVLNATQLCRNCNKADPDESFQKSLLRCSICKRTYYCSKECQKLDWKQHKKTCRPKNKREENQSKSNELLVNSYVKDNLIPIVIELATQTRQCSNKDVALELDFKVNHDTGVAPALKQPLAFKIQPVQGYLEGERNLEPDWFFKGTETYEQNVLQFLTGLRDQRKRLTSNQLFVLVRHADGSTSVYKMTIQDPGTKEHLFGPTARDAIRRGVLDESADPKVLEGVFSPSIASKLLFSGQNGMTNLFERLMNFADSE